MERQYPRYSVQKAICVDALASIHYFEFDDKFVDEPEAHEAWELVYLDRGACEIVADGREFTLHQGEICFHKPGEEHMLRLIPGVCPNVFIMAFHSSSPAMHYFEGQVLTADMGTKQHIAAILHEASATFALPFNQPQAQSFVEQPADSLWAGEQTILLRLELMLIELVRQHSYYRQRPRRFYAKEIVTDEVCLRVIAYMEDRIYGKINLDELSRALSFSRSYLSRRFTAVCGYSMIDYYNMMKIDEAKRLIRETGRNFFEISELLQFANAHYFSTLFKRHAGMTPTQYKKSCRWG